MRAYRMGSGGGTAPPKPEGISELMYQISKFHAFLWLSGGVFSDYYIHQIDECSWMKDAWPVEAMATGGRHYRGDSLDQNFDTYSVQYTYPDGAKLYYEGRNMLGVHNEFASYAHGTKGSAVITTRSHHPGQVRIYNGQKVPRILTAKDPIDLADKNLRWAFPQPEKNPQQLEWDNLVAAIRQGRKIYDNIKKASIFIIAVHVPIAGLALLPLLDSAAPLILLPIHIVIIEMIIDPTCALVFEAEQPDRNLMKRPPRPLDQKLFSLREVTLALLQGLSVFVACTVVYEVSAPTNGYEVARTLVFCTLISSLIALIYFNRSWTASFREVLSRRNPALYAVTAFAVICLVFALFIPIIRDRFSFAVITLDQFLWSSLIGLASLLWVEIVKAKRRSVA